MKNAGSLYSNSEAPYMGAPRFANIGNIDLDGQLGQGARYVSMDGATPAVSNCVIPIVLHMPDMFYVKEQYAILGEALRAYIELHAKSIDGLDFEYTTEYGDSNIGHDGQTAGMPLTVKRSSVNPSFTWDDNYGMGVFNSHFMWQKMIQHPDTNASILSAIMSTDAPKWVWSTFSMTVLIIQPDPTALYDRIYDAAVYTCMTPQSSSMIGFKKQIATATIPERSISYRACAQHNENTRELGYLIMQALEYHRPNFDYALTEPGISDKLGQSKGIVGQVKEAIADYKLGGGGLGTIGTNDSFTTTPSTT